MVGSNCRIQITHIWEHLDDSVGGASPSGTISLPEWEARIEENLVPQLLIAQGIETARTYACTMQVPPSGIYENDELLVTWPPDHFIYNVPQRIFALSKDSAWASSIGHLEMSLRRVVRSRSSSG